jgi:cytoskeletal protein CcmA (bactofilin family)
MAAATEKLEVAGNVKVSQDLISDKVNSGDGSFSRSLQVTQNFNVSGNTGLGMAAATEKLEVAGNVKVSQDLISDKVNLGDGSFSRSLQVTQNFNVSGNTGLGVAAPTEKLEVAGNIKSTADVVAVNVRADKGYFKSLESDGNLTINGNVGVGVAPGNYKLSVAGDSYFNGLLTAENLTVKQSLNLSGAFTVGGTLGVGVANPEATLHVGGDGKFDGDIRANKIIVNAIEIAGATPSPGGGGSSVSLGDNLLVNGSVGIGTNKVNGYKLSVNGKIRASGDIKVYLESEWSDFVFEKNYKLRTLQEVEQYISKHGHLPDMPSAEAVKKNGIDLGAMDAKLLQKIEELTLYVIEMKKENEVLKKEVNALKSKSTQR